MRARNETKSNTKRSHTNTQKKQHAKHKKETKTTTKQMREIRPRRNRIKNRKQHDIRTIIRKQENKNTT